MTSKFKTKCANCGDEQEGSLAHLDDDGVGTDDGRGPAPGHIIFCLCCGAWNVFGEDLRLCVPSPRKAAEIAANPVCSRARQAWEMMVEEAPTEGRA